jgi:hypothetical protein
MNPSTSEVVVMRNASDLQRLVGAKRGLRFCLDLPGLTNEENRALERRLQANLNACGCSEATVGLFVGFALDILAWALFPGVSGIVLALMPVVLMASGKIFGLRRSKVRLQRVVSEAVRSIE